MRTVVCRRASSSVHVSGWTYEGPSPHLWTPEVQKSDKMRMQPFWVVFIKNIMFESVIICCFHASYLGFIYMFLHLNLPPLRPHDSQNLLYLCRRRRPVNHPRASVFGAACEQMSSPGSPPHARSSSVSSQLSTIDVPDTFSSSGVCTRLALGSEDTFPSIEQ